MSYNDIDIEKVLPADIEKRSFEIITEELGDRYLEPDQAPVIKRVIHTTADFEYADSLYFSPGAVKAGQDAIRSGAVIITDTNMGKAGINKRIPTACGGRVECFMADGDVAEYAKANGTTRAYASMEKAAELGDNVIFAVGNAPTALIHLYEMVREGRIHPRLIIGVPVGFVNVIQAKELILTLPDTPCIVARGRKGGSNVAAAIINALSYTLD